MAIDKGGLQYSIEVDNSFSDAFAEFQKDTADAEDSWQSFKAAIASVGTSNAQKSFQALGKAVSAVGDSFDEIVVSINQVVEAEVLLQATNDALIAQKSALAEANAASADQISAIKDETTAVAALASAYQRLAAAKSKAGGVAVSAGASAAAGASAVAGESPIAAGGNPLAPIQDQAESFGALNTQVIDVGQNLAETTSRFEDLYSLFQQILAFRRSNNLPFSSESDLKNVTQIDEEQELLTLESEQNTALATQTTQVNRLAQAYITLGNAQNKTGGGAASGGGGGGGAGALPGAAAGGINPSTLQSILGGLTSIQNGLNGIGNLFDSLTPKLNGFLATFLEIQAFRAVFSGFSTLVNGVIDFNAELEKSELSMAALFLATGDVRDALNETVVPSQGLALAQAEALKQTQLLRQEALSTTSTFDALLKTFQVSIAPGLNAGLNVDQIRQFSVAITQAAGVIGVADNQIAHEVRDILAGTINNSRGDQIAKALGIDNQTIANAKTQGTLVQLLQQKFEAFSVAGQTSLNTFDTILKNVKAAIDQVIGSGGLAFFNNVKKTLQDLFSFLTTKDNINNVLTPSPQAVTIIKTITDALSQALDIVKELVSTLGTDGLQTIASDLATGITVVANIVSGFVTGLGQAFKVISDVLQTARGLIQEVAGVDIFDPKTIQNAVALLTKYGAVLLASNLALGPIKSILEQIGGAAGGAADGIAKTDAEAAALFKTFQVGASLLDKGSGPAATLFAVQLSDAKKVTDSLIGSLLSIPTALGGAAKPVNDLAQRLTAIPGIIQATSEHAKDFDTNVTKINEDLKESQIALTEGAKIVDLTGSLLQQNQTLNAAKLQGEKESLTIQGEINQALQLQAGITAQIAANNKTTSTLDEEDQDAVKKGVDLGSEFITQTRELAIEQAKLTANQLALNAARAAGNKPDIDALTSEQAALQGDFAVTQKKVADTLSDVQKLTNNLPADEQKKVNDQIITTIQLKGEELNAQNKVNDLARDQFVIQAGINAVAANKASLEAIQNTSVLARQNALDQVTAAADLATFQARNELADQQNLVAAQNKLNILTAQVEQQRLLASIALQENQIRIDGAQKAAADLHQAATAPGVSTTQSAQFTKDAQAQEELANELLKEQGALIDQNNIKYGQTATQIAKATEELQHQQAIVSQPFAQGLIDGFKEAALQIPGLYKGLVDLVKGTITSFTSFVSESIVDAFDPTKDGTLQQRFAEFLQGIAKQVLNLFFELAIQKAILGLGFLGTGGPTGLASGIGALGFADGGEIKGYATGGPIRPAGLDPRDVIPIWAAKGEYMQPERSVRELGLDFMERIRRGGLDVAALRAAAGLRGGGSSVTRVTSTRGYAAGGPISPAASPSQGNNVVPAVIISSDENVERFLAGGTNALLRILESNKTRLRAIVG